MTTNNTNVNKTQSEVVSDMKRREIGALWRKEGKASGQKFLTGHLKVDDLGVEKLIKVIIFSNKNKTNPKAPDFVIYTSREDERGQTVVPQAVVPQTAASTKTYTATKAPAETAEESEDNVL